MKKLFLLSPALICLSFTGTENFSLLQNAESKNDSGIINHKLDGMADEWPGDKFSSDKETSIQYATDNDAQNLYLAMKIADQGEQIKLMRMGMNLYFDLKGKHKQNMGIEFPVKKDNSGFQGGGLPVRQSNGQGNEQETKPDIKKIRMMLALNLLSMKLFGFTGGEPVEQNLETEGSLRIAFNWDSTDVMHIEYLIPLIMLGDMPSLNQKMVSIGWKVNGVEMPPASGSNNNSMGGIPNNGVGNRRPGGFADGRGNGPSQADMEKMMKEQEIWTKYTFTIPSNKQ
jgi:hypothetical protein